MGYIIFTSGSTGRPKGVSNIHQGVRDLVGWLAQMHNLDSSSVIAFSNTISFDAHVLQVYPAMYLGCRLVIARPKGHMDPDYMASLIVDRGITSMVFTVPTVASEWIQSASLRSG